MKWRFVAPAIVFVGLVAVFALMLYRNQTGTYDPRTIPSPLIGKPVPLFRLSTVEDPAKFVDNRDYAGKPYVVNVWGTWCGGCRQEHPVLLQIAKENLVPMIGVDWNDDPAQARQWLRMLGDPYVATGSDQQGKVAIDFGVYGAPETFLIDAQGVVLYKHIAPMTLDVWQKEFVPRIQQATREATQP